ncbi:hypothetical protein [Demequina sp.]|uniref:hypothetical protein n=1 Tax=Demequina sp. TaxID=2050685 RepID=UPI0025C19904|nr:hypothetical protein [Demequina sp.]
MSGFAVIDLETIGFACNHTERVCEIRVVLVAPDGRREDCWSTPVNPQRDRTVSQRRRVARTPRRRHQNGTPQCRTALA